MSDKLRILFAIGSLSGGGSERQMLQILQHLDRARFTPLLYLVDRRGELLSEVPADVPILAFSDRHRPSRWNFPGRIHRAQVRDLARILREERIDVVYERTYFMTLIAAPAARQASVPRVATVVTDPQRDVERTAGRFVAIKRRLLKRAYHEATRVIAVSEGVRKAAIAYYRLPPERVVTICNFVDLERIDRLAAEPAPVMEEDRFHIVTAGRLHPQKGLSYLIEALDELVNRRGHRRLRLHLLGQGEQEQDLRSLVKSKGLEGHVRFAGFVDNPYPFFRNAQLFCLPSLYEGMPNVLIEAMACRVPVVATDCPSGPAEILAGGNYGRLVPPADVPALSEAIETAVLNNAASRDMASAAQAHVQTTFSLSTGLAGIEAMLAASSPREPLDRSLTPFLPQNRIP